jgi:hypothetical protein
VAAEITSIAHQLKTIWSNEPIPDDMTFLYFGLFDLYDEATAKVQAGLYLSGGTGPNPIEELGGGGSLPYLPEDGYLKSHLLEQIKITGAEQPEQADVLDYALMLGGAALAVKGAIEAQGVSLPVYVGFDSGDFLSVSANQ